jgi:hypothetical protein
MTVAAAYGFRLAGVEDSWLRLSGAEHWPLITCVEDRSPHAPELLFDVDARQLRLRADIPHSELVHPLLGRVGARLALAKGGDAMHAGAAAGDAGAWVLVGQKGAGKSTLLAALARAGTSIIADDVLVFANGVAMTGPRCVDLRPDAAHLGPGIAVRPRDPRLRVPLPPLASEHPLVGVIHLEWSQAETAIESLDPGNAVKRLLAVRADKGYPSDPRALFDLAALPTLCLKRPRSMTGLHASVELVKGLLEDSRYDTSWPAAC